MKGKILKVSVIIVLILAMTMTNFIFVGNSLISYALDNISTNNSNVEFSAYFKDATGQKVTNLEKGINSSDINLYLHLKVKQQGYFNGKITLDKANFTLKEAQNEYINKIEGNVITLNQINAGKEIELEIPIEFIKSEIFDLSLLDMESEIKLEGIYRDSSEKDKEIKADKLVTLKIVPENKTSDNIENSVEIITNKTLQVAGEKKRVVQILINTGLKDNSYPIKEININTNVPDMGSNQPKVSAMINLNTMTKYEYNYENKQMNINFKNENTKENYILWKKSGNESIVLTYLYNEANVEDIEINGKIDMTLYDQTKIETNLQDIIVNKDEEKEEIITAKLENSETMMYKGKLYQGIDRDYTTKESINVNAADIVSYMEIKEKDVFATQLDYEQDTTIQGTNANIVYKRTTINKEQLLKILGENGILSIKNEDGEIVGAITKESETDDNGNVVIDYGENGQKGIVIRTTAPVTAGKIDIIHNKAIKQNDINLIKESVDFNTALFVTTNLNEGEQSPKQITKVQLNETTTSATLETNKAELSTVVENNIELKAVLKSKSEENDLYKNPILKIEFPEEVENITINDISIVYDDELKIKNYQLDGRILTIEIDGEQTHYSENAVEGASIVINGKIKLNKKAATKDTQITMTYSNEKANAYENDAIAVSNVKVVAPTDVTTVTTIEQLGVEEVNQDATKEIMLQRGTEAKEITPQIEIINNKENTIKDVKVLGTFPTGAEDSIGIDVTSQINVQNANVYYSENENATDDLSNAENGWSETIQNSSAVKKYLITADEVNSQDSIVASYNAIIPANLEYNENASQNYQVTYTDEVSNLNNTVQSTKLRMTTGVGPQLKATLSAKVGTDELKDGDQVKAGEVIKYHIEVSNIGTEIAKNITLSSPIPEGTTLVEAKENFEYTGASYYVEVGKDDCKEEIDQLEAGDKIIREYEVRVDKDITDGTITTNKASVKFDDVTTESNELKSTLKSGDIRVSVKRVTDRRITLTNDSSVIYYAIVENTTSQTIDNVKIVTDLSNIKVEKLSVISGQIDRDISNDDLVDIGDEIKNITDNTEQQNESEEVTAEEIEYNQEVNIGSIAGGENKILKYTCIIEDQNEIELSVKAIQGQIQYRSNVWEDVVKKEKITMNMSTTSQNRYVKDGDIIEYVINIVNDGDISLNNILIKDFIPNDLTIRNVEVNNEKIDLPENNSVREFINLAKEEQATIKITAVVDDIEDRSEASEITNKAVAVYRGEDIATTNEVVHIIQPDEQNQNNNNDDNNNNDTENNNIANGTKIISGIAWYDENANGKKDENETTLSGITVNLLNAETNKLVKDKSGNNISATTNENGTYILGNIGNGKYIVIFNYNSTEYALTKYRVEGVDETRNSNAMINEISIEGANKKVASTDIIQINNNNISDVNIGLIKLQNFDLKLEKFVSRILIQNSAGTTVREYNDSTMAKVELDSKQINNTTVIIEYNIRITNVGEVEGYVKKVADYMPTDLKFSSELNKDWYQSGDTLYNSSLANDKLAAGETKTLTLTLTKSMTENNTGRVNNTAEIAEAYNELGLSDSNSTPGNKTQGENDMGLADVIISIKTGEIIFYTTMIIIFVIIVLSGISIPLVKKSKKEKTRHKFDKI